MWMKEEDDEEERPSNVNYSLPRPSVGIKNLHRFRIAGFDWTYVYLFIYLLLVVVVARPDLGLKRSLG